MFNAGDEGGPAVWVDRRPMTPICVMATHLSWRADETGMWLVPQHSGMVTAVTVHAFVMN